MSWQHDIRLLPSFTQSFDKRSFQFHDFTFTAVLREYNLTNAQPSASSPEIRFAIYSLSLSVVRITLHWSKLWPDFFCRALLLIWFAVGWRQLEVNGDADELARPCHKCEVSVRERERQMDRRIDKWFSVERLKW